MFPAEAEAVDDARGEIVHEYIALLEQSVHKFLAVLMAEVDGGAELVAVHVRVEGAVGVAVGDKQFRLDLDNLRAVEAEEHRSDGACKESGEIGDADTCEHGLVLRVAVAGGGGGNGLSSVLRFGQDFLLVFGQPGGVPPYAHGGLIHLEEEPGGRGTCR